MRWPVLLVPFLVIACASESRLAPPRSVSAVIARAVADRPAEPIVLARATDFPWDRVYIFGPYTPAATLRDSIGGRCCGGAEQLLESSDDHDLLVFVPAGADPVVERHPRNRGDFAPAVLGRGIPRAQAVFRVDTSRADGWRVLHLSALHASGFSHGQSVRRSSGQPPAAPTATGELGR